MKRHSKFFQKSVLIGIFLTVCVSAIALWGKDEPQFERMKYNNPGLVVDLGVGLWAWPVPVDFNGDGFTDLVVCCPDKPYNGTYVFLHPGTKETMPVFKKAIRISRGGGNIQPSYVNGKLRVLAPGNEYPDFLATGLENPAKLPLPANVHSNKVRGNQWRYVDYNDDGTLDLLIGVGDWKEYGWDNAYDEKGNWINGPLRGLIYLVLNRGTNDKPRYETPTLLQDVDGNNVEVYGSPCPNMLDWDGDGDLDLLCGEFVDSFTYFQNVGTRTEPKWAKGVKVTHEDGSLLTMDLEMITPVAFDWTGDGLVDILCGDEDGRVALIENTGKFKDGVPVFLKPKYFRQEADELKCGALATPCGFDWDGDGDWDIICGNTAGYIMFYENLSGPGVDPPKWAAPTCLEVDGKPIRILAGSNGSIQGPCEAKWGYTTQTVGDWDGDGLPDIMVNSIWGKVVWYKNIGTRKEPKLAAAQPIDVEWDGSQPHLAYGWLRPEGPNDKRLLTQWRTTPVMYDLNEDGLMDLLMLDHEGYFCFFERKKIDGWLVLSPPKRVLVDENGQPYRLNARIAGHSGRRKFCVGDYDGDGAVDFFVNAANAEVYRQVGHEDGKWFFKKHGLIDGRNISGHSTSPTLVDFDGNGILDPLVGAEDGYLYYKKNPRTAGADNPWYRQAISHETDSFKLSGSGFAVLEFQNDAVCFGNRDYRWKNIPEEYRSRKEAPVYFTQTLGGERAEINITARKDATLLLMTGPKELPKESEGSGDWKLEKKDALHYDDRGKTAMSIYSRPMKQGETIFVPQFQWAGCIVLLKE